MVPGLDQCGIHPVNKLSWIAGPTQHLVLIGSNVVFFVLQPRIRAILHWYYHQELVDQNNNIVLKMSGDQDNSNIIINRCGDQSISSVINMCRDQHVYGDQNNGSVVAKCWGEKVV